MRKKYVVLLPERERAQVHSLIGSGAAPARTLTPARLLLKANQGAAGPAGPAAMIAGAREVHPAPVVRVRQAYATSGLDAALHRQAPDREYRRTVDGAQEAHLVALAWSAPPEGWRRWTRRRLADGLVELGVVDTVSDEPVRHVVKQPTASRG